MGYILNARIIYSILFYILLMLLIITIKPRFIFDIDGDPKKFGITSPNTNNTIYSLGVVTVAVAILSFYIFCLIDIIFDN